MPTTDAQFTIHSETTAPAASQPSLKAAEASFGMVPNLHKILAESPAALEGYATLWSIFDTTSFTRAERQIVYLTSNYENECRYCMAGHSVLAKGSGLADNHISAIRDGVALADPRLEALRAFTSKIVVQRGWVSEEDVQIFLNAGFTHQQVLEVILGVAVKVISNYTNHVADTPLDDFMAGTVWTPPSKHTRVA